MKETKRIIVLCIFLICNCASLEEKYIEAAAEGNRSLMDEISAKKGNLINAREERNWTALIAAASTGRIDVVKYLIEKKASLNLRTKLGDTAIYRAAAKGNTEIIQTKMTS